MKLVKIIKNIVLLSILMVLTSCANREVDEFGNVFYGDTMYGDYKASFLRDSKHTIYFKENSFQMLPKFIPLLDAQAKLLKDNPHFRVYLIGHSSGYESSEFSIITSHKYAEVIRNYLHNKGVSDFQMISIVKGKEEPVMLGMSTQALQKNRRVELVFQQRKKQLQK